MAASPGDKKPPIPVEGLCKGTVSSEGGREDLGVRTLKQKIKKLSFFSNLKTTCSEFILSMLNLERYPGAKKVDCQGSVHRVWIMYNAIGFHNVTLKNKTGPSQRKRLFVVKECTTQIQQENRPLSADIHVEWISEKSEISAEHMKWDSCGCMRHNGVSGCDCVCVNDPNMWVRLEKLGKFVWTGAMKKGLHKDFSVSF